MNPFERYRDANEPDWADLKRRALFPDIIGRKPSDDTTLYWMNCGCGMLVMTTCDHAGQAIVCASCKRLQHDAVDGIGTFEPPRPVTLRPKTERQVLAVLVFLCLVGAGVLGDRVYDAPARAHADGHVQLD